MRMLYILNVANRVNNFCMSSLIAAKELNIEYHIAANWGYLSDTERISDEQKYGIYIHQVDFIRSPLDIRNYKAYKQLNDIVRQGSYDIIHCNTPIGGVLGRMVAKKYKIKNVIYQAHGFHFYKGAPKRNWLIYYPIERWLAHYTDTLITINQEDYELAKNKFHLRNNGQTYYVPGVGIDLTQYQNSATRELRFSLGVKDDDIMIISAGDLIDRKNYKPAIKAIAETGMVNIQYCICGTGPQHDELVEYAKTLGVESQIKFLGFRTDIKDLFKVSDIFLFTTKQEGLPRSMMEAMASGLPCVVSNVRGNTELLIDGEGGYLCNVDNATEYANAIKQLADNAELRLQFGTANLKRILRFELTEITNDMESIYVNECDALKIRGGVIGYDLYDYYPTKVKKRLELGLVIDDIVIISVGRLDVNKNNETTIRAVAKIPNVKLLICGDGELRESLTALIESLGVKDRVFLLGNRTDMLELYQAADIFIMMSFREGLSRSMMEAMASGLPCIASNIRGNVDLIEDGVEGCLAPTTDIDMLALKINFLAQNKKTRHSYGNSGLRKVCEFEITTVKEKLMGIYRSIYDRRPM